MSWITHLRALKTLYRLFGEERVTLAIHRCPSLEGVSEETLSLLVDLSEEGFVDLINAQPVEEQDRLLVLLSCPPDKSQWRVNYDLLCAGPLPEISKTWIISPKRGQVTHAEVWQAGVLSVIPPDDVIQRGERQLTVRAEFGAVESLRAVWGHLLHIEEIINHNASTGGEK